jgi:hypothetical protein
MKRLLIIFLTVVTVQGARCDGFSEAGVSISGGTSFMFARNLNSDFNEKPGYNAVLRLHYGYNFTYNWALLLGVEAGYAETIVVGYNVLEARTEIQNYYRPVTLIYTSNLNNLKERNRMVDMQASLMLRYQTPALFSNIGYYVAAGIKAGSSLWNTYSVHIDEIKLACDFPAFGQYFEDFPEHNLITEENINREGKTRFSVPNISLEMETGIKYRLNKNLIMYLGVFINYGLMGEKAAKKRESLNDMLIQFKPIENSGFTYEGFLNSNTVKLSSISRFHTGFKLCFALSSEKYDTRMNPLRNK